MSESARVSSIEALKQAKAAMLEFADAVTTALTSVDADINRTGFWLTQDRPAYWKRQIRLREESINAIRSEIMRKRIIAAPEPASAVEEEKRLDRAKMMLDHARARHEAVRRWGPVWDREAMMYKTSTHAITEFLHRDVPRAVARIERMMESLEQYTRLAPPTTDAPTSPDVPERPQSGASEQGPWS